MTATLPQHDLNILITDDDAGMRSLLKDIVQSLGSFQVHTATCGDEAYEFAQGRKVHLALLDMQMPRLTGLDTLQLLRQSDALLPAILITADATLELTRRAQAAHVFSVIPKPFHKNVISSTVTRALVRFYGDDVVKTQIPNTKENA